MINVNIETRNQRVVVNIFSFVSVYVQIELITQNVAVSHYV